MVVKVLLVNPPRFEGVSVIREERCEVTERYSVLEPYSLLQIGALLRERGHQVSLTDLNGRDLGYPALEQAVRSFRPDAVLFRFTPTTFDWDIKTAQMVKGIDKYVRTAGICWTLRTLSPLVMEQVPEMDAYVRSECESVAPALVDAWDQDADLSAVPGITYRNDGGSKINEDAKPMKDYDSLPMPAYDLLPDLDPYFVTAPAGKPFTILYTSKGCPFKCSFCTVAGTPWKMRSAPGIMDELRFLKEHYGLKTASFFDETFTFNRKRVEELCLLMKEEDLRIKWYCNTRAHLVDRQLLEQMRSAGCRGISFGIESGSQRILDSVEKHISVDQAKSAVQAARQAGIKTFCSFILGLPGEDWDSVNETLRFVKETLPTSAQFNVAVPYPGTKLYEQIHGNVATLDLDFRKMYQDDAIVGTEKLSPQDLNRAREMAYRSLYTSGRWWRSNIAHVLKEPADLDLAVRYAMKIANNYLLHGMKHAH